MPLADPKTLVDYAKSLDCIHCGLCLQTCPTYRLTGAEPSSPRGRIHLMRAVGEGRLVADAAFAEEMEFCLLCRHCESVCPAGVRFGAMMETARGHIGTAVPRRPLARLARWLGFRVVLQSRLLLRLLGSLLRLGQVTGLLRLAARLGGARGRGLLDLPRIEPLPRRRLLSAVTRPRETARAQVAVLEGCVMPELFPRVGRATVTSLARLGVESRVPRAVVCCGSLHAHNGDLEGARVLARRMIDAFEELRGEDGEPLTIVVNSAGCGAHMKECFDLFPEGDPWRGRAEAFARRVVDYTELVASLLDGGPAPRLEANSLPGPIAWGDPCHLCHGQGVRDEPRRILDAIGGLRRVELADSEACCGSAGIYSLLRPDDSRAVLEPKLRALADSGARVLVSANPGCQLQWEGGLRRSGSKVRVLHIAELLAEALR